MSRQHYGEWLRKAALCERAMTSSIRGDAAMSNSVRGEAAMSNMPRHIRLTEEEQRQVQMGGGFSWMYPACIGRALPEGATTPDGTDLFDRITATSSVRAGVEARPVVGRCEYCNTKQPADALRCRNCGA